MTSFDPAKKLLPDLDVVVPCYNEQDDIIPCLDALLEEVAHIKRIVLVDNNSTDDTLKIMRQYARKSQKITVLEEKTQGLIPARNTGMDFCASEIIARIDADAIVMPGWALAYREYYAANSAAGYASGSCWYHDVPLRWLSDFISGMFVTFANKHLADMAGLYGANMSLRRSVWEKIRPELCDLSNIAEDTDIAIHADKQSVKGGFAANAQAKVSARRIRMSPLRFWRYNQLRWNTYRVHDQYSEAYKIRGLAWLGNILQAGGWFILLFHDPRKRKFSLKYFMSKKSERVIT